MEKQEKYYLMNNYLPVVSNCSFEEIKKALILDYGYRVNELIELTQEEYYNYLKNIKIKYFDYFEWN